MTSTPPMMVHRGREKSRRGGTADERRLLQGPVAYAFDNFLGLLTSKYHASGIGCAVLKLREMVYTNDVE